MLFTFTKSQIGLKPSHSDGAMEKRNVVLAEAARMWCVCSAPFLACLAAHAPYTVSRPPSNVLLSIALLTIVLVFHATTLLAVLVLTAFAGLMAYLVASDLVHLAIPAWACAAVFVLGIASCISVFDVSHALVRAGAGLVGAMLFRAIDVMHRRCRGQSGLGSGDALFVAAIGPWFTPQVLCLTIFLGCSLSAVFAARPGTKPRYFPLIPGLASAGAILMSL